MEPTATGQITIDASPRVVYELISDPVAMVELGEETTGVRWVKGASAATVGARFTGANKHGVRRWSTTSVVTDADQDRRFAFDVSVFGIPVSRWQYDIEPAGDGCTVVESTWSRVPTWFVPVTQVATGVRGRADRAARNTANIATTLRRLKDRVEG